MGRPSIAHIEELTAVNSLTPFEQRELIIGYNEEEIEVYINPASTLIGGPPNSGKSVLGAWFCVWVTHMDGRILLIDPHCNSKTRGLTLKVSPLREWFIREPVDFTSKQKVLEQFEWIDAELLRRELPGGITPRTKMVWLIIDELNEFLSRLSREEKNRVATIVGNVSRAGAKFGCFVLLLAHQWNLSKSGGGDVRSNVMLRISTGGEVRQMSMTLDVEDDQVKELWKPPIKKGDMLVRLPNYLLRRLHIPIVTTRGCEEIAKLVKRAIGSPRSYVSNSDELFESMQNGHEEQNVIDSSQMLEEQNGSHSVSDAERAKNREIDMSPRADMLSTPTPVPRASSLALSSSVVDLPPEPLHSPQVSGPHVSEEDRQLILAEGERQLSETGKVGRDKIRIALGWDSDDWPKIKAVCDEMGWHYRMKPHKQLSTEDKQALKEQAGYTCQSCGVQGEEEELEIDHIRPRKYGINNDPSNLQVLCHACHQEKTRQDKELP